MKPWLVGLWLLAVAWSGHDVGRELPGGLEPGRHDALRTAAAPFQWYDLVAWSAVEGRVSEIRHVIAPESELPLVPDGARVLVSRRVESLYRDPVRELRWTRLLSARGASAGADTGYLPLSRPGWRLRRVLMHPLSDVPPRVVEYLEGSVAVEVTHREEGGWVLREWNSADSSSATPSRATVRWAGILGARERCQRFRMEHEKHCRSGPEARRLAAHLGEWQKVEGLHEVEAADQAYFHVVAHVRHDDEVRGGEASLTLSRGDEVAALVALLRAGGIPSRIILSHPSARFPKASDPIDVERGSFAHRGVLAYPGGRPRFYFPQSRGLWPHEVPSECRGSWAESFSEGGTHRWRLPMAGRERVLRRRAKVNLKSLRVQIESTLEGERLGPIARSPCRGVLVSTDECRSLGRAGLTRWSQGFLACQAQGVLPAFTPCRMLQDDKGTLRVKEDLLVEDVLEITGAQVIPPHLTRSFSVPGVAAVYEVRHSQDSFLIKRRIRWRAGVLRGGDAVETLGVLGAMRELEGELSGDVP